MFAARLRAYAPGGASLGLLPDPLSWQASVVHGDLGALNLTYSTLSAGGPLIERPLEDGLEVAVEVWDGSTWVEPRGCRFVRVAQGADQADDMDVYSITLPSYGWLLGKARLTDGTFTDGWRVFTAPLAGDLVGDIMAENAAIGGVPVSVIGGTTTDAAGASWPALPDQGFEYAADYLGIVRGLQEAGALDWATQARGLYLYLPDSAALSPDLSATMRLTLGLDIGEAPADETIESLVSQIAVRAQAGGTVVVDEPTAPTPWGKWQGSLAVGQVDSEAAATAMGEAELERSGHAREQYTRDLILHDGAPVPLIDYWPGAWVTAPTDVAAESVRVQQVTLTFGSDGFGGNVVLNDRLVESDIRRARTLATLAGGQVGSGGAPLPIAYDPEASRIPSTPTGLDVTAGLTFTGPTPRGVVTATWNVVTTATDSGALTISGYEFQYRIGAGDWQTIVTPELSAQVTDLTPGDAIDARVRAVGARTTLPSAWSAIDSVTVPGDVTAPSVPTGLSIASALRIAEVSWAGTLTSGIPADFAWIEIAIGTTSTPTTVYGRLLRSGTLQITGSALGIAIGTTTYARARSVDSTGNVSAYSSAVSVVMAGIAGPDLAANSVTANTIAAGAIDGKLITGATVRSSATNPRTEMNSSGFFAYNASGVETISILGSTSTITGATVRTAASGDRLEMTTAGLKAWTSGTAVAEFLPGGMYLRAGGELVVEYSDSDPAFRVGDLGSDRYGIEMYNLSGVDVFTLSTNDVTNDVKLTMDGLDTWTVWATDGSITTGNGLDIQGGVSSTSLSRIRSSSVQAYLKWRNTTADDENSITADSSNIRLESIDGGVVQNSITLDQTDITVMYDSQFIVDPKGTPTWAGGPSSSTLAILANNAGVSLAYQNQTNAANGYLTTAGTVQRTSSSLRYKQDVEDLGIDLSQVLALRPRTWRDKGEVAADPDTTHRIPGFIAEEVHALGLTEWVTYEDGVPESIQYDRISAAQQLVLIDHEARLNDALNRLAALEAA